LLSNNSDFIGLIGDTGASTISQVLPCRQITFFWKAFDNSSPDE
jgi:hypothetical protein